MGLYMLQMVPTEHDMATVCRQQLELSADLDCAGHHLVQVQMAATAAGRQDTPVRTRMQAGDAGGRGGWTALSNSTCSHL